MLKNKRLVIKLLSKFKNNILKSKFANLMINVTVDVSMLTYLCVFLVVGRSQMAVLTH